VAAWLAVSAAGESRGDVSPASLSRVFERRDACLRAPREREASAGDRFSFIATEHKFFFVLLCFLWLLSEHVHHRVVDESVGRENLFVVDVE